MEAMRGIKHERLAKPTKLYTVGRLSPKAEARGGEYADLS